MLIEMLDFYVVKPRNDSKRKTILGLILSEEKKYL